MKLYIFCSNNFKKEKDAVNEELRMLDEEEKNVKKGRGRGTEKEIQEKIKTVKSKIAQTEKDITTAQPSTFAKQIESTKDPTKKAILLKFAQSDTGTKEQLEAQLIEQNNRLNALEGKGVTTTTTPTGDETVPTPTVTTPTTPTEDESGDFGFARGGIIITKPTYLPSSGVVVGEHPSWSGKGAYAGGLTRGIPDRRNKTGMEGIVPFDQRGIAIMKEAVGLPVASAVGAQLNASAFDKIGYERGRGSMYNQPPAIVDASTNTNVTNNTIVRSPSPRGQEMHFERSDFVHKIA